jgi:hypothetical protein
VPGCSRAAVQQVTNGAAIAVSSTNPPAVCADDRATIQTAIDAFTTLEGRAPRSLAELVPNYLRSVPIAYALAADGSLQPAPGARCG